MMAVGMHRQSLLAFDRVSKSDESVFCRGIPDRGPLASLPSRRKRCSMDKNETSLSPEPIKPAPKKPTKSKAAKDADLRLKQARRASTLLKQVSDPTRLQVILALSEGERHVGALCEQLNQSQPAVSHHLALLRHGG